MKAFLSNVLLLEYTSCSAACIVPVLANIMSNVIWLMVVGRLSSNKFGTNCPSSFWKAGIAPVTRSFVASMLELQLGYTVLNPQGLKN